MQIIQKYRAEDGTEFENKKNCAEYEQLCKKVKKIMSVFPPLPENDGCRFANGHGFIQHKELTIIKVKNDLLDLIATKIEHPWIEQTRSGTAHLSYVARLLDDYGIRPFCHAWNRLYCIDPFFREWGQPYYALNPNEGEQFNILIGRSENTTEDV